MADRNETIKKLARRYLDELSAARSVRMVDGCGIWYKFERVGNEFLGLPFRGPEYLFLYVRAIA